MARKHQLRVQRTGTIINSTSKGQESDVARALKQVVEHLVGKFHKNIFMIYKVDLFLAEHWRLLNAPGHVAGSFSGCQARLWMASRFQVRPACPPAGCERRFWQFAKASSISLDRP
jgi:hypothetical protein